MLAVGSEAMGRGGMVGCGVATGCGAAVGETSVVKGDAAGAAAGTGAGAIGWGCGPVSIWIGRAGGFKGVRVWAAAPDQTSATDAETIRARRIDKDSTTFSVRPF
jgi:hypothetical protein